MSKTKTKIVTLTDENGKVIYKGECNPNDPIPIGEMFMFGKVVVKDDDGIRFEDVESHPDTETLN